MLCSQLQVDCVSVEASVLGTPATAKLVQLEGSDAVAVVGSGGAALYFLAKSPQLVASLPGVLSAPLQAWSEMLEVLAVDLLVQHTHIQIMQTAGCVASGQLKQRKSDLRSGALGRYACKPFDEVACIAYQVAAGMQCCFCCHLMSMLEMTGDGPQADTVSGWLHRDCCATL